jgi:predicted kinase
LTGASGAGKTTLINELESKRLPEVACFNCDAIYADLPDEIRKDGMMAQDAILSHWVTHVLSNGEIDVAVMDTQIRPHRAHALLSRLGVTTSQIVLVECEQVERNERLRGPRAQVELVNAQMESWAAYLRGQADALGLERIDTSGAAVGDSVARLKTLVQILGARRTSGLPGPSESQTGGPRLVIVCGLPGSGKTAHATQVERKLRAVRLCPDEWMDALEIDLYDSRTRAQIEGLQWRLAQDLLTLGHTVIIEWGTWARSERDVLRTGARALGAAVELHFLDAPAEVLFERIRQRNRESPPIRLEELMKWAEAFDRPSSEEMTLFDPPGNSC